ncbi:GntR family transcriptional regulator [Pseudomonas sp. NFACC13-1]|uniref:GntR family transcriptional regulator n=1 Tax=Pseudomonas sp. NFACC13-1 TaxID=1566245 RepID=UPI00088A4F51|nr:GntR family transcriptional regulator [Pseudomonas sp. NFACC13-1]SDB67590.1 DNA-binding transcriptional regulator, GntR family [Pseudomonas sp. NFACC13-1]
MNAHVFHPDQLDHRLPKTAQVYELLRSAIISLKLQPGETISEKDLCAQLDISRTPLREAILQLANQKLIIIRPNASTVVSPIKLKDVLEGQLVRETLEMRSVKLAARFFSERNADAFSTSLLLQRSASQRKATDEFYALDEEFHKIICECSGYPNLWRLLNGAKGQLDRVRRLAFPVQNHFDEVIAEHEKIAAAIMSNDETAAENIMLEHLDSIFETLLILIDERADFFTEDSIAIKQCKELKDFRRLVG